MVWIEDLMNVATFARAAEVQCWITSCNVQLFWLASKLMPKLTEKLPAKLSSGVWTHFGGVKFGHVSSLSEVLSAWGLLYWSVWVRSTSSTKYGEDNHGQLGRWCWKGKDEYVRGESGTTEDCDEWGVLEGVEMATEAVGDCKRGGVEGRGWVVA